MKNSLWHQSASTGLIIGALTIALVFLNHLLSEVMQLEEKTLTIILTLITYFKFIVLFWLLWDSTLRYARRIPKGEFSFGQGLGFVVMAMVFSGFLAGFGYYIQYVKLAPDYIPEMVDKFPFEDESAAEATKALLSSVGYWIMVAVFQMAFFGSIIGVIISLIIRRKHDKIGCEKEELSQENNSDETIQ
ncbi:MAG: DUF4199 domain-containing protein [Rikenellaceae bacterium]|nr:DUF4199 domain-containing protein [Rikenellaceae bacterium]